MNPGIRMIRPLLIMFVMLAHFTALDATGVLQRAQPLSPDPWLTVFLKSVLARGGVPLLSLISGYLAVRSLEKYGYLRLMGQKVRRLVWPLIWANALFILLIAWPEQSVNLSYRADLSLSPFDPYGWFQAIFAFYRIPANAPLYFLKDLFTCFALLPLLLAVARVPYVNIAILPWMAYKVIFVKSALFLPVYPLWFFRFDILLAFYLGILLFQWRREIRFASTTAAWSAVIAFLSVCAAVAAVYVTHDKSGNPTLFLWLDFAVKFFSVIGCIGAMSLLSAHNTAISRGLHRLGPYAYSMFLTHLFTFWYFGLFWERLFGKPEFFRADGSVFLLLSIATATAMAVLLRMVWGRLSGAGNGPPPINH